MGWPQMRGPHKQRCAAGIGRSRRGRSPGRRLRGRRCRRRYRREPAIVAVSSRSESGNRK
ncbi:hypothetical protein BMA10247_A1167 [Burkholderia mallei NCTC 10247]|nr:hypothetical protein BMA10247_A1167 [Burkholderia mallei NCTC 10247]